MLCVVALAIAACGGDGGSTPRPSRLGSVVDGRLVDLPLATVPQEESDAIVNRSTFECSGDSLVLTAEGGFVSSFSRVGG